MRIPYLPPKSTLLRQAINVVDAFDNANKLGALDLGMSNVILKKNVEELRRILNQDKKRTKLTAEEAEINKKDNLGIGKLNNE